MKCRICHIGRATHIYVLKTRDDEGRKEFTAICDACISDFKDQLDNFFRK